MDSNNTPAITGAGDNPCSSCSSLPSRSCDFSLAYNNSNLSDRVLRIEIIDPSSSNDSSDGSNANRHRKRRRDDNQKDNGENSPEGAHNNDSNQSEGPSRVVRVETVHISSAILAAKSQFFRKLFLNGMMESQQRHATLQISSSEEAAVTELLKFMYGKSLSSTSAPAVLDILMVADKFEVPSCKWSCCQLLLKLPMSLESALLYLELPSSLSMDTPILDLIKSAKQFLINRYSLGLSKSSFVEMLGLPLVGVEALLSSDDFRVGSEDMVYVFVFKWAMTHYQNIEERRDILATRLVHLIRFPYMTCRNLKHILTLTDPDHELLSKLVLDALLFKLETPYRKSILAVEQSSDTSRGFVERNYIYRPIKVVELLLPRQQCVVYFDLKREECVDLFPSAVLRSDLFALASQYFHLSVGCMKDQLTSTFSFWMGLRMLGMGLTPVQVDYQFAAWSILAHDYVIKFKGSSAFIGGNQPTGGSRNLFNIPWSAFIHENSDYFINGILHLRAEATITG